MNESLPTNWIEVALADLIPTDGLMSDGDWIESKDQDPDGEIRLIQLADIGDGRFRDKSARFLTRAKSVELGCTYLKRGDILIARMPDPLGRACIFPLEGEEKFVTVVDVCVIRVSESTVSHKFLAYLINFAAIRQQIEEFESGTTRKRISGKNLARIRLPLPPLNEQRRIVAKIEELFSELDKGIENLKQARAQLAVYRQALLKHAFEGRLTANWRQTHAAQLGSTETEHIDGLPKIPDEWAWQRLGNISAVSGGLTKNPKRESLPERMKYLRVANVHADRLDLDDVREIGVTQAEAERLVLEKGDLLVVEGNGGIDQIGRVAEWTSSIPKCGHQNHLIRVRLQPSVSPRYALRFLQSPLGRDAIVKEASSTSGLHTLSISKVGNLKIPVTSTCEQEALLELIEPAFDNIGALESDIDTNLQKAEALRQSILKKAFAGELVPQDPNDEPAAALLARLRAEREASHPKGLKARPVKAQAEGLGKRAQKNVEP